MAEWSESTEPDAIGVDTGTSAEVNAWFVREVLPLEGALLQFLRRHRRNESDLADLRQEIYARVYEAAQKQIPRLAKPFVFRTAHNLLVDHIRHEQIIPIDAVANLDTLDIVMDQPLADRVVIAREELHRLQTALNQLPRRCKQAVMLRKIEGLSLNEIALRMGVTESTVEQHLTKSLRTLAGVLYGKPARPWRKK
ncbi:MAG TPA: RNA polymerase sigma factor [Rhizomicrobium sp.]|jgi:RNA polymerase sigma factor (sigma-70 family)|nr:RNA polymerase sigma factor [Rhizomicrobium sp.]